MNQTTKSPRGGKREGSGRERDYRKRCEIYAIQLALACSESTARRTLRDYGRANIVQVVGAAAEFEVLQAWDEMSEFDQGMVYGILKTRVGHMLDEGWGRRL
jgi:hypothetical protein